MSKTTIIVGSGVAAVAVSRSLLTENTTAKVVILEAGENFQPGVNRQRAWVDFVTTRTPPTMRYQDKAEDADINANSIFDLVGGRLIVKGGSTNHWGGWSLRMKPEDFRLGDARPGALNWEISYDDLEEFYHKAELFLDVRGDSNTTSVPRKGKKYPQKPLPYTALGGLLIPTLKSLGANAYEPLPLARHAWCVTSGTCRFCPVGARYEAAADLDKLVVEFNSRVQVIVGAPVISIDMKDKKTAVGVTYINRSTGKKEQLLGDRVVVASGTIESPKILQASTSTFWPRGIGNDTDHVGRYLVTHPLLSAYGRIENNTERLEQEVDFPTMASRFFDTPQYQKGGKMFFVRDGKYIVMKPAEKLIEGVSPDEINAHIASKTRMELRALIEAFPAPQNRVTVANGGGATGTGLPRSKIDYAEHPDTATARVAHMERLRDILYKAGLKPADPGPPSRSRADHSTGTCRMSSSAATGVVDKNLCVHDTENIYVASNAVFPNSGAVNPTLTLVALSLRLGKHLAKS
ncbi:hypothetical protein C2U47_09435 [Aeromonas sp. ASNIH7]|uniref:GMC oxidoreductase n=1 Tax=Aeromonas sp. ASNIH7 TaxID=1920107 RepID=UPI000CD1FCE2|nr:GMC family oxidoreductase [Aeromonas sp. ASNIH7]AUV16811.1 hypothetical protein C2U47_09435 [Aeromonas sp. ASNIH7]